jgi:hypothetical protein
MHLFRDIHPANLHYYNNDEAVKIVHLAKWMTYGGVLFTQAVRLCPSLKKFIYGGPPKMDLWTQTF